MDRTPGSVSMKLCNFASLDPVIYESGRKGLSNVSKKDREIWAWHIENPKEFQEKSQKLLDEISDGDVLSSDDIKTQNRTTRTELKSIVKIRIGQSIFRKMVLENYQGKCCFSGVDIPQLLVASHIVPWADREDIRLNPRNGLCLSSIHDRAFDQGYWTLSEDSKIIVSEELKRTNSNFIKENFLQYEGGGLLLPKNYNPDPKFLYYHREIIFKP
ncbi:MAG: restriction endonuclease [Thalassolituus sp.]|nr:MAG: restriction endonuclease [Thalassolituus sp.]